MFDKVTLDMQALCVAFPWNANYWTSLRWFHDDMTANLRNAGHAAEANAELQQYGTWLQSVAAKLPAEVGTTSEAAAE